MNFEKTNSALYAIVQVSLLAIACAMCLLPQVVVGYTAVQFNTLSYEGVWDKFDTLSDAEADINSTGSGTISPRDVQFAYSEGVSGSIFAFITAHNLVANDGSPSPSNTNEGFLQIYDIGATTVTSSTYSFFNPDNSGYRIEITGENALRGSSAEYVRAGVGAEPGLSNSQGGGDWLHYDFDITFSGLTSNVSEGAIESTDEPGAVNGTGYILFQARDTDYVDNLGFYRIDLNVGNDSWAVANNASGTFSSIESDQGVIPEASRFTLFAGVFIALASFAKRRF